MVYIHQFDIVFQVVRIHIQPLLQLESRLLIIALLQQLGDTVAMQFHEVVPHHAVVGIYACQTLQSSISLKVVIQLAIQGNLPSPQVTVVWLELQQLVYITDCTAIVL